MSEQHVEREQRVTPLELFFDLVFVFGFTQVTTVFSDNPTWSGLGHGLLILAALWWAWASYAWLTNTVDPGVGAVWGAMLVAMAAMFVAALAVPETFGDHGVAVRGRVPDREPHVARAVCALGTRRPRPAGGDPAERSMVPHRRRAHHRRGVRRWSAADDALGGRARCRA